MSKEKVITKSSATKKNASEESLIAPAATAKPAAAAPVVKPTVAESAVTQPAKAKPAAAAPVVKPTVAEPAAAQPPASKPQLKEEVAKPEAAPAKKGADKPVPAKTTTAKKKTEAKKETAAKKETPVSAITIVIAKVDVGYGNSLYIRGEGANLSWEKGILMENAGDDEWSWSTSSVPDQLIFKFLVNDDIWSAGDNFTIVVGETFISTPIF